jgi:RNA polymerase sigma factor (sigma-70 family)
MNQPPQAGPIPGSILDQIGTCWHRIYDLPYFATSYGRAIRRYLEAFLKNTHDAEEVTQDFLLRVHQQGLANATPERGRFRDYIKRAVRNAALNFLRHKHAAHRAALPLQPEALRDSKDLPTEKRWLAEWRGVLLGRAWRALADRQQRSTGSLCHTVLRLTVDHPHAESRLLAAKASYEAGRPVRPDAFRKQLSRARLLFAECLIYEVAQTLTHPTADQVDAELSDLGLMAYVRDFLPPGRRGRPAVAD